MSTRLIVVGAVGVLCLSMGPTGAETPAAAAETPALAPEPMHWGPMRQGPMRPGLAGLPADVEKRRLEWMARALGLSAEQKAAFGKILEQQRTETEALHRQVREGGRKLSEALEAAMPEASTVGTLLIEQRALLQKLEGAREQTSRALRALLTAEQGAALDALPKHGPRGPLGKGRGPAGDGMGPMGPPPMPPAPEPTLPDDVEP